jgi:hypothetical protein
MCNTAAAQERQPSPRRRAPAAAGQVAGTSALFDSRLQRLLWERQSGFRLTELLQVDNA